MQTRARDILLTLTRWSEGFLKTDITYLVQAGFWSNLNALIIAGFSFGLYVVYAHFLPKETYGTYQYLLSLFSIATAFTLTGMNTAVARAVAQGHEGTLRASVRIQLRYGIIPFLGALIGALYYFIAGNMLLASGLLIIGIGTPMLYAYNSYGALFIGRKNFRSATAYGTVFNLIYYVALAGVATLSTDPLLLLATNLSVQVIVLYTIYHVVLTREKPNDSVDPSALSYGMHLSALGVLGSVAGQVGSIFAFHFLGPVALATFSFASALPDRLSNICFKFLGSATLARFSERTAHEIRAQLIHKMLVAASAGLVLAVFYISIAPLFFTLFFPAYLSAVPYSTLYAVGFVVSASYFLPTTALTALKRTHSLYVLSIVSSIFQICFPLIGMFYFQLWGLISGQIGALLLSTILATILVYKAER
ncbi:MAG: oligosaccharide flippase family protein [Minisyncoccia bacterium]